MTTLLLAIEDLASAPRQTSARLIAHRPGAIALAGYAAGAAGTQIWMSLGGPAQSPAVMLAAILALAALETVFGCFWAALSHFVLDVSGERGSARSMFAAIGTSGFAKLLLIPCGLALEAFSPSSMAAGAVAYFCVTVLQFWLAAEMVRPAYGTTAPRAWAALLTPFAAMALVLLAAAAFLIAALAGGVITMLS
ncbi:MAG: hypothetical protein WC421_06190 [Elusimicrobiales bacterium]